MLKTLQFQDIAVPQPGFGAMSLSMPNAKEDESLAVLKRALDLGQTFWDTASGYGFGHNEALIGKFLKAHPGAREWVFIASKCGFLPTGDVTNSAAHINETLEKTIEHLGTTPDLYYLHRRDPDTPLEESIGALATAKKQGKTKYIGLSEPSAQTLREAAKIAHIDALEIEYSPWFTDHERDDLLATAKEMGVAVVAFSPLGKGILTGKVRDANAFKNDVRGSIPRYTEHLEENFKLVVAFEKLAEKKGCTPSQLSIAWVAAQGVIPIPGTKSVARLEENWGAHNIELTAQELAEIRKVLDSFPVTGDRYPEKFLKQLGH